MEFPRIDQQTQLRRLEVPSGILRMVLDTDTFNEIDDQFAVAYALLSPERLKVEAICAAPFVGHRAATPGEGMQKSHEEILRLLDKLGRSAQGLVEQGSTSWLTGRETPEPSQAALRIVKNAMDGDNLLYVVGIAAPTNIASAILIKPEIVRRIVVIWLGGQPHTFHTASEYNLKQDPAASRVLLDSGVPLIHIPCYGVASHLLTTVPELESALRGRNRISDFLLQRFSEYSDDHFAWAKEIWDIASIGYLMNEEWVPTNVIPSPILNPDLTWGVPSPGRHLIREAWYVRRNPIFRDLFLKLRGVT